MIESIRNNISYEEFDYQTLLDCLQNYACPRDKISDLLRKGLVIRVKKGLYIFGDNYRRQPYSREILANLIYGPSYISLEFALYYFGLIPEHVEAVTSVTRGRSRKFSTPIGLFTYRMIPLKAFSIGMSRIEMEDGRSFLMAVPEKALADKIRADRGTVIQTQQQLYEYLVDNLRIDAAALTDLNAEYLSEIARCYRSRKIKLLSDLVHHIIKRNKGAVYA